MSSPPPPLRLPRGLPPALEETIREEGQSVIQDRTQCNYPQETAVGQTTLTPQPMVSNLSALAAEWFPSSFSAGGGGADEYYNNYVEYPTGYWHEEQHVPQEVQFPPINRRSVQDRLYVARPVLETTQQYERYMKRHDVNTLDKLNTVIDLLEKDPGGFESMMEPLAQCLNREINNLEFLQSAVLTISNNAMYKTNFCYNGARLCVLLDTITKQFRKILINEMIQDLKRLELSMASPYVDAKSDINHLNGLSLFMGEIYIQFIQTQPNELNELALQMISCLNLLLSNGTSSCIKNICKLLKLTGRSLVVDCPYQLNDIIARLEMQREKFASDRSLVHMIHSVLNLHLSAWGTMLPEPVQNEGAEALSAEILTALQSDDTVYFGPDGKPLTEDEETFLSAPNLTGDPNDLWDPNNEIDEEIHNAFKDFLRLSGGSRSNDYI